jgi:hypothetical protein
MRRCWQQNARGSHTLRTNMHAPVSQEWVLPQPGMRVRQIRRNAPFVVQRREILECGGAYLTRHPNPTATAFVVRRLEERSEIGLPCFVIHLSDEHDDGPYVVDTGLMGPGLPTDTFEVLGVCPPSIPIRKSVT